MFIGHFGVGLAAKSVDRRPSLGTFFMAAQFIDLLWPVLLLFGLEKVEIDPGNTAVTPLNFVSYPISHSLLGVVIWSVLFGAVYYAVRKHLKSALLMGVLVLSHWLLDLVVHRPDLPLTPFGDAKYGLGLWNSPAAAVIVEGLIFAAGIWIYARSTRAANKTGRWAMWGLFAFLALVYAMNLLGPPPDSADAIGYVGLSQWLIVGWGYWIDRNRTAPYSHQAEPPTSRIRESPSLR